ncbi:DUF2252 family protein [Bdellovibrio sp. SKB1291214]|uniref:DUF2252 family protein n=1 Tax=Bdellovibrio sp. SKB1291214 TaxID=1732569 RepID=UPI000B51B041|nr:DUF2252 family protein [Bdellovibrio sp. SKB1291214]UYL07276.1 DUF2252 family protein [Bdellovibrio sp. SKB1291214]
MKSLFLNFALCVFCVGSASAVETYSSAMKADWHHEEGLFNAFRANAPHYWNWLKAQSSPILAPAGVVVGDPHILNFGDVQMSSGGREFALIDIDDGGPNAPLAGDLIRYAAGNQVSPFHVSLQNIFDAYIQGLQGQRMNEPEILLSALSHSDTDYHKRQNKYLSKMTEQNRFSAKAKLTPIAQAGPDIQELFQKSRAAFEAALAGYLILDTGYKTKLSGGSQGLPRFWYLIQKNQDRYIIEFKFQEKAATSFYSEQGAPDQRFPYIAQIYRPSRAAYGPYNIVTSGGGQFLMRARLSAYLDFDSDNDDDHNVSDGQKMSLYIANRLGLWHGQQTAGKNLLNVLNFEAFEQMVKTYVSLMMKENS